MSAHAHLRKATANAHDRVDAAFASFDLSDARPYGAFLQRHAAAFLPAEDALTRAGAGDLIPDWEQFLRGPALIADLARMGLSVPAPKRPPDYADPAAIFGGAYVLEGSRLGGALLRRCVGAGFSRLFLDSVQPPGRWRAFIALLDHALYQNAQLERATKAALETFALFEIVEAGRV